MIVVAMIVGVAALGALAYWRYADADRSERLSRIIGPVTPLLLMVISLLQVAKDPRKFSGLWLGLLSLAVALWAREYRRTRAISARLRQP